MQLIILTLLTEMNYYDKIIGIDFGSSTSCAGFYENGKVQIIQNELGNSNTPSIVSIVGDNIWSGERAKQQMIPNPYNTFYTIKKLIGFENDDDITNYPFKTVKINEKLNIKQYNSDKTFEMDYIASIILKEMKETAGNFLGTDVKRAVLAVPAYFNENQTKVIREAGFKAGFNTIKIVKEPNAAVIAYGLNNNITKKQKIIVFHLGGFTNDVSLLSIENSFIKVLDSQVDNDVCGDNFNNRIVDYLIKNFEQKTSKNVSNDHNSIRKLKMEVERAIKSLSLYQKTRIIVENFFDGLILSEKLTREKFEEINDDLFQKSLNLIQKVLTETNTTKDEIDEVILVGGSTKIPKIQEIISDFFNGKKLLSNINPEEVVAYGASLLASCFSGDLNARDTLKINPYSFSVKTNDNKMTIMIHENTHLPIMQIKRFNYSNKNQKDFQAEIYVSSSDDLFESLYITQLKMGNLIPNKDDIIKVDVSFEFYENFTLKVTAKSFKEEKTIEIDIQKERKQFALDYYQKMVSKKAEEINTMYTEKLKELKELRKNYLYQIRWFIIFTWYGDQVNYEMDLTHRRILLGHLRDIFPEIYNIYQQYQWEERQKWEREKLDF